MASTGHRENTPEVIRYLCSSARASSELLGVGGWFVFVFEYFKELLNF